MKARTIIEKLGPDGHAGELCKALVENDDEFFDDKEEMLELVKPDAEWTAWVETGPKQKTILGEFTGDSLEALYLQIAAWCRKHWHEVTDEPVPADYMHVVQQYFEYVWDNFEDGLSVFQELEVRRNPKVWQTPPP